MEGDERVGEDDGPCHHLLARTNRHRSRSQQGKTKVRQRTHASLRTHRTSINLEPRTQNFRPRSPNNAKNKKTRTRNRTRGSELKFAFQRTRFGSARARASRLRWEQEGAQHDPTARGSSGALTVNACRIRAGGDREARSRKYGKDGNKGGHDARPRTHGEGRTRGGRLTLLQKVTWRMARSKSVRLSMHVLGAGGGLGGERERWTA